MSDPLCYFKQTEGTLNKNESMESSHLLKSNIHLEALPDSKATRGSPLTTGESREPTVVHLLSREIFKSDLSIKFKLFIFSGFIVIFQK